MSDYQRVPEDAPDDWQPEGYAPGPDDPGPVDTECGPAPVMRSLLPGDLYEAAEGAGDPDGE